MAKQNTVKLCDPLPFTSLSSLSFTVAKAAEHCRRSFKSRTERVPNASSAKANSPREQFCTWLQGRCTKRNSPKYPSHCPSKHFQVPQIWSSFVFQGLLVETLGCLDHKILTVESNFYWTTECHQKSLVWFFLS